MEYGMSYKQIIEEKLKSLGANYVVHGDEIKTKCLNPEHIDNKPSYFINVHTGVSHCFSCGFSPHPSFFLEGEVSEEQLWESRYAGLTSRHEQMQECLERHLDRQKEVFLPPEDHALTEEWRGISSATLQSVGAYYCSRGKFRGRNVFPVIIRGVIYGFDARVVDTTLAIVQDAKWIRPRGMPVKDIVYPFEANKELLASNDGHILIVEGVADALSYIEMGSPALASFGLTEPSMRRIEEMIRMGVTTVTLAFDNDEAGFKGIEKLYPIYKEFFEVKAHPLVTKVTQSGCKDANDYLIENFKPTLS